MKPRGQRVRVVMPYGDGQYLLEEMRNPKYPERMGKVRFPGGGIEDGETPEQAAARELREELGVTVDPKAFKTLGTIPHHEWDHDEHYLRLADHGLQPGVFDNAIGGDAQVHLVAGSPRGDSYYGPDVSKLIGINSQTGPAQAGGAGLLAIKKIAAGPIAHIAGASGSGKSTVLNQFAATRPDVVVKDIDEIDYDAKKALGYPVELHTYTPDMHTALSAKKKELSDAFVASHENRPVVLGGVANDESGYDTGAVHKLMLSTGPLLSTLRAYRRDRGTEWGNPLWKFPKHYLDNRRLYRDLEATGYEKIDPADALQRLQSLTENRKDAAFDMPGVGVRHTAVQAAGGADTMGALRMAKMYSDSARWQEKTQILRELITNASQDWHVDSDEGNLVGVRHFSGWRYHLPKAQIADLLPRIGVKPGLVVAGVQRPTA